MAKRRGAWAVLSLLTIAIGVGACGRQGAGALDEEARALLAPLKENAKLFIKRENAFVGGALPMAVKFHGKTVAKLRIGTYIRLELEPGDHAMYVDGAGAGVNVPLTAEAGEVSFLLVSMRTGRRPDVLELDEDEGRAEILGGGRIEPRIPFIEALKPPPPPKSDGRGIRVRLLVEPLELPTKRPLKIMIPHVLSSGVEESLATVLTDASLSEAAQTRGFEAIGAADVDGLLSLESQNQLLACDDSSCYSEIGAELSCDLVLTLVVGRAGATYRLSAKVIDVHNVRTVAQGDVLLKGEVDELIGLTESLVGQVLAALSPK